MRIPYILVLLSLSALLYGQDDEPWEDELDSISIYPRVFTRIPPPLRPIPSQSIHLGDYLAKTEAVFIRSYGLGLASISARGGSAAHTQILWEDIPLQNPMLGQTDLSLYAGALFEAVKYERGSAGLVHGGGSLGGALKLSNTPEGQSLLTVQGHSLGSIALQGSWANKSFRTVRKWNYRQQFKFGGQWAANRYRFRNTQAFGSDKPIETAEHAQRTQFYGLWTQELSKTLGRGNTIWTLSLWPQYNQQKLQPSLLQTYQGEQQTDWHWRAKLNYTRLRGQLTQQVQLTWLDDCLHFQSLSLDAPSHSRSLFLDYKRIKAWHWAWGAQQRYVQARHQAYGSTGLAQQFLSALWGHKRWGGLGNYLLLEGRQEYDYRSGQIPLPQLALEAQRLEEFSAFIWIYQGRLSQQYRLPTLNDLYWQPGGNPNLKPEHSLGLSTRQQFNRSDFKLDIQAFVYRVSNWILWTPAPSGLWTPENLALVWSRGLEFDALFRLNQWLALGEPWQLELHLGGAYQHSSSQRRQLIYTPQWQLRPRLEGLCDLGGKRRYHLGFSWGHQLVGSRYVLPDHSLSLPPYWVGDLQLRLYAYQRAWSLNLSIENLYNQDYEVVHLRPMPRRFVQLGFSLRL